MASSSGSSASSGVRSGRPPRANPSTRCRSNCLHNSYQWPVSSFQSGNWKPGTGTSFLSLTELEALACSLLSVLLPLLDACVARQEAGLLEPLPPLDVVLHARARDARTHVACLTGDAAAGNRREHIELIGRFGNGQWLLDLGAERFGREGLLGGFPVPDHAAGAGAKKHAGG